MCVTCADIPMGICSCWVVIISVQDLTASPEALSHAASATLTATNTLAVSSKHMQKACYETFHTTNAIALRIANIKSLARGGSNMIVTYSNGQQRQQGKVLHAA